MKIGYVCSFKGKKDNTNSDIVIALKEAGCQTIFNDLLDCPGDDQSNLILALEYARAGDILVVWDTSTLCLDSQNFIDIVETLQQRDITLQILAGNFLEIKPRSWESLVMLESYSVLVNLERNYLS
ncbi:MAG: recombinase family protein [Pleurocapsa sp. SU_5_0]|nr:recombinase family protein [Pleurocapsa sp. SU_5_0]NJO98769.1 recombinase family protein [Pleurocapsa sp. CRU_1_2]